MLGEVVRVKGMLSGRGLVGERGENAVLAGFCGESGKCVGVLKRDVPVARDEATLWLDLVRGRPAAPEKEKKGGGGGGK